MKKLLCIISSFIVIVESHTVFAGERVPIHPPKKINRPPTGIVIEFNQEKPTGAARAITNLYWRDVFSSISDIHGASFNVAYTHKGLNETQPNYERIALEAGRKYKSSVIVWGTISDLGSDQVRIWSNATIEKSKIPLYAKIPINGKTTTFEFPTSTISFAPHKVKKSEISSRKIYTRMAGASVRTDRNHQAKLIKTLSQGKTLDIDYIIDDWVATEGGFVEIGKLDFLPAKANTLEQVALHTTPEGPFTKKVDSNQTLEVVAKALIGPDRNAQAWYKLSSGRAQGWLPKSKLSFSHLIPSISFTSAIVRFAKQHYRSAIDDLHQFVQDTHENDQVNISLAFQLIAICWLKLLESNEIKREEAISSAFDALEVASQQTPFDDRILFAISLLAIEMNQDDLAKESINKAIKLKPDSRAYHQVRERWPPEVLLH